MIISILYFILFIYLLNKWSFFANKHISRKFLSLAFIFKIGISISLFWVYSDYYPNKSMMSKEEFRDQADIFKYYDDSEVIYNALKDNPIDFFKILFSINNNDEYFYNQYYINMNHWDTPYDTNFFNDSHTIIRINALIRIISFDNYFVHVLFFCMLSFIGLFALFKAIVDFFPKKENILKCVIFFTPSILLWNSGILKEPILFFSFGMIMLSIYNLSIRNNKLLDTTILISMSIILFLIKFYVFFIFTSLIIPFIINHIKKVKYPIFSYVISISIFILLAFNLKHASKSLDLLYILDKKQESFLSESAFKNAGSYFEIQDLEPNITSITKAIPSGIYNCFTKPLPWNISSSIELPQAMENFIVILLIIIAVIHLIKLKTYKKISSYNFLTFCLLFAISNFILIGICTPVYGAIVRYKIIGLLFLLFSLLLLIDYQSIYKKLK